MLIPPPNRQVHRQLGGGLGGPQVMLAVILEAENSTATAKFAEGAAEGTFCYPKNDCLKRCQKVTQGSER